VGGAGCRDFDRQTMASLPNSVNVTETDLFGVNMGTAGSHKVILFQNVGSDGLCGHNTPKGHKNDCKWTARSGRIAA
jgi:hypothetical protein